jgi:hypothetical protein
MKMSRADEEFSARMSEPLAISDDTANIYDGYGPQMT